MGEASLITTLENLRQIGSKINQAGERGVFESKDTLQLIVDRAIGLIPNSAAVIYEIDPLRAGFDPDSRVFASGNQLDQALPPTKEGTPTDFPRENGLGAAALEQRLPVISTQVPGLSVHPFHQALGVKTVVCFPLLVRDLALGVLYVYLYDARTFTQSELVTLEVLVNHAAMAIYQARTQQELKRDLALKENELKRFEKATALLFSRPHLDDTLNSILAMALEITGAHYGIFRLINETKKFLITRSFSGMDMHKPKTEALPINEESVMGKVALTKQPILIADLSHSQEDSYYPLDAELKMRSELAIPLVNSTGGLEGVLNLESPIASAFSDHDVLLVQSLATTAVIAIQESRLLEFIVEISNMVFEQNKDATLGYLARKTNQFINSRLCEIWTFDGNFATLESTSSSSPNQAILPVSPMPESFPRQVFQLADLQIPPLVEFYAQNDRVTLSNSLVMWATQAGLAPRLIVVCGSSKDAGQHPLENDWNLRILNFIRSYVLISLLNQQRNEKLKIEQEQRMVAETFAAIGDVASNILHNVNNKVGLIPVKVQSLKERRKDLVANDEYLARNLTDIEKFATEAMRTVSHNLSNLRPIAIGPIDVQVAIDRAIALATNAANVQITTRYPNGLPLIHANEQSLSFIFTNLIDNAIEAMKHEGNIEIAVIAEGRHVKVRISDNGPGIDESVQERIFDLGTNDPDNLKKNLGFGLWWIRTIMFRLGGTISLTSNPGKGTTFTLAFPIEEKTDETIE